MHNDSRTEPRTLNAFPPPRSMISDQEILEAVAAAVRTGGAARIAASGKSMGLEFASVRNIVVAPFDPSAVRLGSIVAFQRDRHWIVHRVLWKFAGKAGAFCITKGDNLGHVDRPYVQASEIQCLVVGMETDRGVTIDLTSARRRLDGLARVARGWLTVGLSFVRFRWPSGTGPARAGRG